MKNAKETLIELISTLTLYLTELADIRDTPTQEFAYGEKTAYVECLEIISRWEEAKHYGISLNIEERFPL